MKEIKIINGKYYLYATEEELEYYTKADLKKSEYVKRSRIKKNLLKKPLGTLYAQHITDNKFLFYFLDNNNKLQSFVRTIKIP